MTKAETRRQAAAGWIRLASSGGHPMTRNAAFEAGAQAKTLAGNLKDLVASVREIYGFARQHAPLLTPPDANMKLHKASVPTYGLTLQHHKSTLASGRKVNLCPWAGECVKVCVLDNGSCAYPSVQRARMWRTHLFKEHPEAFSYILGFELERAVRRHGSILFRPNVNSDVRWERLLPSLTSGEAFGDAVLSYGYTKGTYVLEGDGWVGSHYRVAYSWNEKSDAHAQTVVGFLGRGGSMAVVTDRWKGEPVKDHGPWQVADADLTDEWIFGIGIGDLSAKGKARNMPGSFVQRGLPTGR